MTTNDQTLAQIAKDHLQIETLEARNNDSLDFHTVAVWEAKSALQAAFDAGKQAAQRKPTGQPGRRSKLADLVGQQIEPNAVCAIIALLRSAQTNNEQVNRQVDWLATQLEPLVDRETFNRTCSDLAI